MKIQQKKWTAQAGWQSLKGEHDTLSNSLVFAFGDRNLLADSYDKIQPFYPDGHVVICSTSGEILGDEVLDHSIVTTAIEFEKTELKVGYINIKDFENSYDAGQSLSSTIPHDNLSHVIVISDGGLVNGSELVKGLNNSLPENVVTTGGMAGDAARFEKTLVGYNGNPEQGNIVLIGLYGDDIKVGFGSYGGWDPFGPKRKVTKSVANELFELDGKSALELYKRYLGDRAKELPGSALFFPLSIQLTPDAKPLVRTILSIDEEKQSMVFAGDLPEGATVRLMKSNFDKLVDGAYEAANSSKDNWTGNKPELALLISCVGRKLVLDQRIEEEIESVHEVIGADIPTTGFYSYGEIAPFADEMFCGLHNQTMTITLLGEN